VRPPSGALSRTGTGGSSTWAEVDEFSATIREAQEARDQADNVAAGGITGAIPSSSSWRLAHPGGRSGSEATAPGMGWGNVTTSTAASTPWHMSRETSQEGSTFGVEQRHALETTSRERTWPVAHDAQPFTERTAPCSATKSPTTFNRVLHPPLACMSGNTPTRAGTRQPMSRAAHRYLSNLATPVPMQRLSPRG